LASVGSISRLETAGEDVLLLLLVFDVTMLCSCCCCRARSAKADTLLPFGAVLLLFVVRGPCMLLLLLLEAVITAAVVIDEGFCDVRKGKGGGMVSLRANRLQAARVSRQWAGRKMDCFLGLQACASCIRQV
jgi:hypothetical protein